MLAAVVVAAGCRQAAFTAPSGSAIRLTASATTLPLNGAAEITAFVTEGALRNGVLGGQAEIVAGGGTPVHDGTEIFFTTSLGRLSPAESRTAGGRAVVRLVGDGRSGIATVTAMSGPASASITIDIGAAAASRITVTATPQTLPASGGTSTIAARVEGQHGSAVPGVLVSFSTTRGTLSPASGTSNADGIARTTLTASADATVTATSGGGAGTLSGSVSVAVTPRSTIAIVPPASAMLGVPSTFTVTPGSGASLDDVEVDFGDGEQISLGAISAATMVSHIFRHTGELRVEATATDRDGHATSVATSVVVVPLAAAGSATPSSPTAPRVRDTVNFLVTPAPGAAVDRYRWDFGEGTSRTTGSNHVTHAFDTPGSKVVTVRVFPFQSDEFTTVAIAVEVKR